MSDSDLHSPGLASSAALADQASSLSDYRAGQLVDETVLHDLRGPMAVLQGNLQLIEASLSGPVDEKTHQRLTACLASVRELTGMISDLQCLVHLVKGDLSLNIQPVLVDDITTQLEQMAQARAAGEGRQVLTHWQTAGRKVRADRGVLLRALALLLDAAVRLSRSDPVEVWAMDSAEGGVCFRFQYQGVSAPLEAAEQFFAGQAGAVRRDLKLRMDRARGLMLARAAAEVHQARIGYEPAPQGGCFWFELPAAE
ncbi:MAG TPA: hypothetical protein VF184_10900 [Phycisphaeraceae bacterium]